jgi:hypothetical protein
MLGLRGKLPNNALHRTTASALRLLARESER